MYKKPFVQQNPELPAIVMMFDKYSTNRSVSKPFFRCSVQLHNLADVVKATVYGRSALTGVTTPVITK